MSFTLVLNSSNVVGTTNSQFKYNFLNGNFSSKDNEICISALTVPYSFFNVSTFYNNQSFTLSFPTIATVQTLVITLPAGFYTVTDINNYIQNQCIIAGLYLRNSSGQYVYFFDMSYNTTYYSVQFVSSPVPTAATYVTDGYSLALTGTYSTSGGLPTSANQVPQIILPSSGGINTIVGFTAGTYPSSATSATAVSSLSNTLPVGTTVNSLTFRCNLISNNVTIPSDILDSCTINTTFGSNITYTPSFPKWISVSNGTFSNLLFNIVDQDLNAISARDPNVAITLMIRKKGLPE
jgi:hypothetical protein